MIIGDRDFDTEHRCYIMGILNVTPDSFSDGGKWSTPDNALRHAESMVADGADIIDVGGASTRPGCPDTAEHEETDRVIPVIEMLRRHIDIPISIDTYRSAVASAALSAGAVLVNDIWGLKRDPDLAGVIAGSNAACCLTHNRDNMCYPAFLHNLLEDLSESVSIAKKAGIPSCKIILDPGIGFAKTYDMNLEAINKIDMIKCLGYPVLLGASRKSVIGTALRLPVTERVEGTLATTVIGIVRGCSFVRVHDVRETKRAVMMTEAVLAPRRIAER